MCIFHHLNPISSRPKWSRLIIGLSLGLLFGWPGLILATPEIKPVALTLDSQEMITLTPTGEATIEQSLRFSRPLQDLGLVEASPVQWSTWLGLEQTTPIITRLGPDSLSLQYQVSLTYSNSARQLLLPPLPLPPPAKVAFLQYALPLIVQRQVRVQITGILTEVPLPAQQNFGNQNFYTLETNLQGLSRVVLKQTIQFNQPDLSARNFLQTGLPALPISYLASQPSPEAALPYRLALGGMGLVSLALLIVIGKQEIPLFHLNFGIVNILLIISGFLLGGLLLWLSLAPLWIHSFLPPTAPTWLNQLSIILRAEQGWLLLTGLGLFLWYWALALIRRSPWSRWAALCLLALLGVYVYGLTFWLLPLPEIIEQQRLVLTLTVFIFSIMLLPVLLTVAQPHPDFYIRD